ncbi:glycosyltransferase family 2 protein [Rhizobacter fulvus]
MDLTILMPCLNEARTLGSCIEKAKSYLERAKVDGEVVIADNGSTDGSRAIAELHGARVVEVPVRGYGAALIAGIRAARGKFVVIGDSDDSYDFSQLDAFVGALRGGAELVMGNRFAGGIAPNAMPRLHRYLGNPALSGIGRVFFRTPIRDFHCGLRGFERGAILGLDLCCTGMEFASEMVVKASLYGLRIVEVPTTLSPDGRGRPPHLRSWRDGWRHLRFLLIHAPQWLFLYPGAMLAGLCLALMIMLELGPVVLGPLGLDVHTLVYAMVGFNVGWQMLLFGALSYMHAVRMRTLPLLPRALQWLDRVTLEHGLLVAGLLVLCGLGFAILSVAYWSGVGFAATDPRVLMRIAVPSGALLLSGSQLVVAAFVLEYVRLPLPGVRKTQRSTDNPTSQSAIDNQLVAARWPH